MKKYLSVGTLLLTICSLAACQEGAFTSSSSDESNIYQTGQSQSNSSNSITLSSFSNDYHPIISSSNDNIFSNSVTFSFDINKITKDQATTIVNNDLLKQSTEKAPKKITNVKRERYELKVTKNRSTSTYSIKDMIQESCSIKKIDSENKWIYTKNSEDTITHYFVEDELVRHTIVESLFYFKNNSLYHIHSESSYYEGSEEKGKYESYYVKRDNLEESEYIGQFTVNVLGNVYFYGETTINKIEESVYKYFSDSSYYYHAIDYRTIKRNTNIEYYSSGKQGNLASIAYDKCYYFVSTLDDFPSDEKSVLSKISYEQNYKLNISDYFSCSEECLTRSISKGNNGDTIRDETFNRLIKITEECDIFFPNLNNFEEREYTPPVTK